MGLFGSFRRRRLPRESRPPLQPEERVLAWAATPGGAARSGGVAAPGGAATPAVLVVTNLGLWLPPGSDGSGPRRLGWHEIHKATWSGSTLAITPAGTVGESDGYQIVEDLPVLSYPLSDPGELPDQVRARVTRSVGYTSHHPIAGQAGVRVVARRVPGVNGLRWAVRYDTGIDREDPAVRELTGSMVDQARSTI